MDINGARQTTHLRSCTQVFHTCKDVSRGWVSYVVIAGYKRGAALVANAVVFVIDSRDIAWGGARQDGMGAAKLRSKNERSA